MNSKHSLQPGEVVEVPGLGLVVVMTTGRRWFTGQRVEDGSAVGETGLGIVRGEGLS